MPPSLPDLQVRTYSGLRTIEARANELDELLVSLKRRCLYGGPTSLDFLALAADLRCNVGQLQAEVLALDVLVGVADKGGPALPRSPLPECAEMRGTTDVLAVADLVGLLSSLRKTGTLTLRGDGVMFVFEFEGGRIVHAVTNQPDPDLRLGTILVAQNRLSEQQLEANLHASAEAQEMLGSHLVRTQTVSAQDLRTALEEQVRKIFEAAFRLQHARFQFADGGLSNIAERASLNTTHLLLEAARQCDEKERRDRGATAGAAKSPLASVLAS